MKEIIKKADFIYFPVPKTIAMQAGIKELLQSLINTVENLRQQVEINQAENKLLKERVTTLEREIEIILGKSNAA